VGLAGCSCGLALTCDVSRGVVGQSDTGCYCYSEGVDGDQDRTCIQAATGRDTNPALNPMLLLCATPIFCASNAFKTDPNDNE
jgi:hypothetical protein